MPLTSELHRGIVVCTTVAARDHSKAGYSKVSYLLVSRFDIRENRLIASRLYHDNTITAQCSRTLCAEHYSEASPFTIHNSHDTYEQRANHLVSNWQSFLRFSSTTYSRCFQHFRIKDRQIQRKKWNLWKHFLSIVLYHQQCLLAFKLDWMVCLKPQLSRS